MKLILIISILTGILSTALIFTVIAKASREYQNYPGTGYQVIVTILKPYKVYPFSLRNAAEVDSLLQEHYGPAFETFSTARMMQLTNHFYTETDSIKIEIERKEIKEIRNGEPVLRRRKYQNN